MEFDLLRLYALYAEWFVMVALFFIGFILCCLLQLRKKPIGVVIMIASGAYMAFLYLTPERLATQQKPLEETTLAKLDGAIPPALVLRAYYGDDVTDALTLAETGLFRVFIQDPVKRLPTDAALGEAVLALRPDCATTRSKGNGKFPNKSGELLFTARTGFTRCAQYVEKPVPIPMPRLDLWTDVRPLEQRSGSHIMGIMSLVLSQNSRQTEIGRKITSARMVQASRLGTYFLDTRPPFSQISEVREYDPDVLEFVLAALGKDWRALPNGSLPDAELVQRSDEIIKNAGPSAQKLRVALALAGAVRGDSKLSRTILGKVETEFDDIIRLPFQRDMMLAARGRSDCWTSLKVASGRQAFASACAKASALPTVRGDCLLPEWADSLEEWCSPIRQDVWNGSEKGKRTLVLGSELPSASGAINIAAYRGPVDLRRVAISSDAGPTDLVLTDPKSNRTVLWALEGSLGCLERVTVVGKYSGVIGVDASRVTFRDRFDSDDNILGKKPEAVFQATPNATTVVDGSGSRKLPCRTAAAVPEQTVFDSDQVITRLPYIVFRGR